MIHAPECQANCPCCGGDWDCNCGAITFPQVPVAHDALCPWRQAEESDTALGFLAGAAVCECDLIAKVRRDERDSAVKRIKSLSWSHENWIAFDERAAILAAIKAGQP